MAREKRQFDENSKLGFMRAIQVYNVIVLFAFGMVLLFIQGSTIVLDFSAVTSVIMLLAQAAEIWLIAKRKLYTRQFVVVIELFEAVVLLINSIINGDFSLITYLLGLIPTAITISYFWFSRRAKAVLVQPWSSKTLRQQQEDKDRELWDPKSVEFWMRLLLYFFAFSIIGHWMEMGVQILVINGIFPGTVASPDSLTWRDNLNPFPIYGIAVAFCGLALYPLYLLLLDKTDKRWKALVLSFLVNALFCATAELVLGFFFNADYHAWDYRDQFLNFQGQVCLLYTIAFGVLSSLITWVVYPVMERYFSMMNRDLFRVTFGVLCVLYLFIFIAYNIDPEVVFGGSITASSSSS